MTKKHTKQLEDMQIGSNVYPYRQLFYTSKNNNTHENEVSLMHLGTNCLLIQDGETRLMIDPHFTRPTMVELIGKISPDPLKVHETLSQIGISYMDAVLVTHAHYDHALDAAETAVQSGALLTGSQSIANIGRGAGLSEDRLLVVEPKQVLNIGNFKITPIPWQHQPFPKPVELILNQDIRQPLAPPIHATAFKEGDFYAYLIEHNNNSILVISSGFIKGGLLPYQADTLILTIGGLNLQSKRFRQESFREVILASGAKQVLLSHWDDFTQPLHAPARFIGHCERAIEHLLDMAADYPEISIHLLPLWHNITLF